MRVRVLTLGGLQVFREGEELLSLPGKRRRCALLVYLAVERISTREEVMALLWPERDPDKARHALNQTLYELRNDLGSGWLESSGDTLRVTDDMRTDLGAFVEHMEREDFREAIALYGGPFLKGVHLAGARAFEDWMDRQASRAERLQRRAHSGLVQERYDAGSLEEARLLSRSWTEKTPLDDEAQNWFIRLLAETGHRTEALEQYQRFKDLLAQELEVEPLDETRKLVEEIRSGAVGGVADRFSRSAIETPESDPGTSGSPVEAPILPGTDSQEPGKLEETEDALPDRLLTAARMHFRKLAFAGVIILGIWEIFGVRGPRLNPAKVMCFPPTVGGTFQVQTQDVCQSLQVAVEGIDPLILQAGFPYLGTRERQDPNTLTVDAASTIALQQGAGYFLLPAVTAEGDSLLVSLALHESRDGKWIRSGSGSGTLSSASSGQIAARAMVGILPEILDPGRKVDLTFITERDPGAVALWMEGERLYRNLKFDTAYLRLRSAVHQDSLLARAAIKGALAAGWDHRDEEADTLVTLALRHRDFLTPKHRELALGMAFFHDGQADSAAARFQAAIALDPEWNEAWIRLGEVYYHQFPRDMEVPGSAIGAFRKALELDPNHLTPLVHLAEHELRAANAEGAGRLIRRIQEANPGLETLSQLRNALDCVRSPLSQEEWVVRAGEDPLRVLYTGTMLGAGGSNLECAEGAFRSLLAVAPEPSGGTDILWGNLMAYSSLLVAQGRGEEAGTLLREAESRGEGSAPFLYLIQAAVCPALAPLADHILEIAPGIFGPDLEKMDPTSGWAVASWVAAKGNMPELERLSMALDRRARERPDAQRRRWFAMAARARLAILKGDTVGAVEILDAIRPEEANTDWGIWEVLPHERLLLAQLNLALGRYPQALTAAEVFDHPGPIILLGFLPQSLAVRVQAAEAMGFLDQARECRDRLRKLGRDDLLPEESG